MTYPFNLEFLKVLKLKALSKEKKIDFHLKKIRIGLVSLFNGISTFVGYFMPKFSYKKNSSGTI